MALPVKYVIEMGLDSDVGPRYDGTYPHLMSLARVESWPEKKPPADAGKPCWFTGFQPGDQFVFRACDYTQGAYESSKLEIKGLYVVFLDTRNPRYLAPGLIDHVVCTGHQYFPEPGWESVVIPGAPGWCFLDGKSKESILSFNQVQKGTRALLRVSVAATYTNDEGGVELRWFTHDPEIIVGEGGPPT